MENVTENPIAAPVRQINSPESVTKFIFAGKAQFTLRSKKSGTRYTYRVTRSAKSKKEGQIPFYFVSLLTGADNDNDYQYIGVIDANGFRWTRKARHKNDSPSVVAFSWFLKYLLKGTVHEQLEFWHAGHCGRCGRTLTVPESIDSGFGPECVKWVS
jgi:hypothetical protein